MFVITLHAFTTVLWALVWWNRVGTMRKPNHFLALKQESTQTQLIVYLENMDNGESSELKTAVSEVELCEIWVLECKGNAKRKELTDEVKKRKQWK